jgi:hypothetical protein
MKELITRLAIEFDSQDAYKKYLKEHPMADKSNHSVKFNTKSDKSLELAEKYHSGQQRKDSKTPYVVHPKAVTKLLSDWGIDDDELLAAGFAHDLLEDTKAKESDIEKHLGKNTLNIVKEVTKKKGEDKQKWIDSLSENATDRAIILKVADRIDNTKDFLNSGRIDKAYEYLHSLDKVYKRSLNLSSTFGNSVINKMKKDWEDLEKNIELAKKNIKASIKEEMIKIAFEFDTKEALDKYLKEHPKADKRNHSVKKQINKVQQETQPHKGETKQLFTDEELSLPKEAHQKVKTKEEVYKQAQEAQDQMLNFLDRGQGMDKKLGAKHYDNSKEAMKELDNPGIVIITAPLKGEKRAEEKVNSDYEGDWSRLTDAVRASIAVDKYEDIPNVVKSLKESGIKLAKKPKDRFSSPNEVGYRDTLMNVEYPNGHIGELQLHVKPMLRAKEIGHKEYEKVRTLDAKMKQEKRVEMTDEEYKIKQAAEEKQKQIYSAAWNESI